GHDLDVGQRVGAAVVAGADEVVGALALGELRGGRIDADGGGGGGLTVLAAVALVRPARAKGQRGQGDGGDDGGGADGATLHSVRVSSENKREMGWRVPGPRQTTSPAGFIPGA